MRDFTFLQAAHHLSESAFLLVLHPILDHIFTTLHALNPIFWILYQIRLSLVIVYAHGNRIEIQSCCQYLFSFFFCFWMEKNSSRILDTSAFGYDHAKTLRRLELGFFPNHRNTITLPIFILFFLLLLKRRKTAVVYWIRVPLRTSSGL